MPVISMRLPDELDEQLGREAALAERPKSELIRDAIVAFLERQERGRFQRQLVRAACARGPAEALQLAGEFLPVDNEALALADSRMVREIRGRYRLKPGRGK
jgi:predicted transcriptional regulator